MSKPKQEKGDNMKLEQLICLDAEQKVLAYYFKLEKGNKRTTPSVHKCRAQINPEYFYDNEHKNIALFLRGKKPLNIDELSLIANYAKLLIESFPRVSFKKELQKLKRAAENRRKDSKSLSTNDSSPLIFTYKNLGVQ